MVKTPKLQEIAVQKLAPPLIQTQCKYTLQPETNFVDRLTAFIGANQRNTVIEKNL